MAGLSETFLRKANWRQEECFLEILCETFLGEYSEGLSVKLVSRDLWSPDKNLTDIFGSFF